MAFRTKLDFSNNRQVKQREKTSTIYSGSTTFGVPYSALTSGADLSTSATTETINVSAVSTFSGNTSATTFNWYDPRMSAIEDQVSAITSSNSGATQEVGPSFFPSNSITIDGNIVNLEYSGITYDLTVISIITGPGSTFTGSVVHNIIEVYSASTLDFTGRTIYIDTPGITRTNKLIVSDSPQVGHVFTCADSEGMGSWQPISGGTTNDVFWSAGTGTNGSMVQVDGGGASTASGENSIVAGSGHNNAGNYSVIFAGYGSTITSGADISTIIGGANHTITNGVDQSAIIGGLNNRIESSFSGIFVGSGNELLGSKLHSAMIGGDNNTLLASRSVILGGQGITGTTDNMVYVPNLLINGLASADPIATNANGVIVAGTSDARLKTNITNLESPLEIISKLRGVSFEWTPESDMGAGITKFGFLAQEVKEVIPGMVRLRYPNRDDDTLTMSYTEVVPWVVEAIKELISDDSPLFNREEIILETQTIASEDNNIELNFNGTHESALDGGVTVIKGINHKTNSEFMVNSDGDWVSNNHIIPNGLVIPKYTPFSTYDSYGKDGEITRDENYIYIKTNSGWKRSNLETF